MARGSVDELSTAAPAAPAKSLQLAAALPPPIALARPILLAALSLGLAASVLADLVAAEPVARTPELERLLHLMVGIKALIFTVAAALVFRRLSRPVYRRVLLGYEAGLGLSAGALVWLWSLTALLPGSILFYGGLLVAYLSASRDPWLLRGVLGERLGERLAGAGAFGEERRADA